MSVSTVVYRNRDWWVADCPGQDCNHAEYFGVDARAGVGGLTPTHMLCPACGLASPAVWPSQDMRRGVEQLLADRPVEHRNWLPHESLVDLLWENLEHGILPPPERLAEVEALGGGTVLSIRDDEITLGARALPASGRLQIAGGA